jgi:hypothetical protein
MFTAISMAVRPDLLRTSFMMSSAIAMASIWILPKWHIKVRLRAGAEPEALDAECEQLVALVRLSP